MDGDRDQHIREKAYRIWQSEGEPHGRDQEHWEQAERDTGDGVESSDADVNAAATPAAEPDDAAPAPSAADGATPSKAAKPARAARKTKTA